ncbi:hypothetical protein CDAR_415071 [Caerostris darwini]|uniref:Ycf15 n=1 Tax=Caerostris darwini TaxID=1538125 RepID=A0AAV4TKM5_9ARAC|nr:hypothetical protein CDAR_415071 [Caerostris darwini]
MKPSPAHTSIPGEVGRKIVINSCAFISAFCCHLWHDSRDFSAADVFFSHRELRMSVTRKKAFRRSPLVPFRNRDGFRNLSSRAPLPH